MHHVHAVSLSAILMIVLEVCNKAPHMTAGIYVCMMIERVFLCTACFIFIYKMCVLVCPR